MRVEAVGWSVGIQFVAVGLVRSLAYMNLGYRGAPVRCIREGVLEEPICGIPGQAVTAGRGVVVDVKDLRVRHGRSAHEEAQGHDDQGRCSQCACPVHRVTPILTSVFRLILGKMALGTMAGSG
jgi:hypothetical protein